MRRQRSAIEQLLIDRAESLGHREPTSATAADVKALEDAIEKSSSANAPKPNIPPVAAIASDKHDATSRVRANCD